MRLAKLIAINLVTFFTLTLNAWSQPPTSYYDIPRQRLLVVSAAQFITNVTQGAIESDSAMLYACRIYGIGSLVPYTESYPATTDASGSNFIEHGDINAATQLQPTLKGADRIRLTLDIATYYLFKPGTDKRDMDSARIYLDAAEALSNDPATHQWQKACLSLFGRYYCQLGDSRQSQACYATLIKNCEQENDQQGLALALQYAGECLPYNDPVKLEDFQHALFICESFGLKEKQIELRQLILISHFWSNDPKVVDELKQILALQTAIGYRHTQFVYFVSAYLNEMTADYATELDLAGKSLQSMQATQDTTFYSLAYMRIGQVYQQLDAEEEAAVWFQKGLDSRSQTTRPFWYADFIARYAGLVRRMKYDSAIALDNAITREYPPVSLQEKLILFHLRGDTYHWLTQDHLARENFDAFVALAGNFPPQYINAIIPNGYLAASRFEFDLGNYAKSRFYLEKVMVFRGIQRPLTIQMSIALMKFELDSASHNWAAVGDHQQYKLLYDSLTSDKQKKRIDLLTITNQTRLKDQNIRLLTESGKLQQSELQQTRFVRNVTFIGIGLLLTIVGLLFTQFRIKQSTNAQIKNKNLVLETMVEEKEWLLREVHHRVKNNLQTIVSLLQSQSFFLKNEALLAVQDSQNRVYAMSLIHQKLYRNENLASIELNTYIPELVGYLRDSFNVRRKIRFTMNILPVELDVSQAIPLGLIVNEAVTNAIKYAFPSSPENAEITVVLFKNEAGQIWLSVADNGVGLPPRFDTQQNEGIGMRLMKGLSGEIQGIFSIHADNGTQLSVAFTARLPLHEVRNHRRLVVSDIRSAS